MVLEGGWVMDINYILTKTEMPGLIKIGVSKDLGQRLKSLSGHSGGPVSFECFYACEVSDGRTVEEKIHFAFGDHRTNPRREFFRVNPERVRSVLELPAVREVRARGDYKIEPAEQEAIDRSLNRRKAFRFLFADVPTGSELSFIHDDKIICVVVDDKKVEFAGKAYSLSALTTEIMQQTQKRVAVAYQGPNYWVHENETLTERRLRLEASETEN